MVYSSALEKRHASGHREFESHFLRLRLAVARLRRDAVRHWSDIASAKSSRRRRAKAGKIMYYIYSLTCKDGFYVGCTDNLKDRVDRHTKGHVPATASRLPVALDFYFEIQVVCCPQFLSASVRENEHKHILIS